MQTLSRVRGLQQGRGAHFLDQTARKPKVRLDTMAEMKPVQLKVRSEADASATPACMAHSCIGESGWRGHALILHERDVVDG